MKTSLSENSFGNFGRETVAGASRAGRSRPSQSAREYNIAGARDARRRAVLRAGQYRLLQACRGIADVRISDCGLMRSPLFLIPHSAIHNPQSALPLAAGGSDL